MLLRAKVDLSLFRWTGAAASQPEGVRKFAWINCLLELRLLFTTGIFRFECGCALPPNAYPGDEAYDEHCS
jgi:hypothetical protein